MKLKSALPILFAFLFLVSCSKDDSPEEEQVTVRIDSVAWQQGNTYRLFCSTSSLDGIRVLKQGMVRSWGTTMLPDINNGNRILNSSRTESYFTEQNHFGGQNGEIVRAVVITDNGIYYSKPDTVYIPQYYTVSTSMGTFYITKAQVVPFSQYANQTANCNAKSKSDGKDNTANIVNTSAVSSGAAHFCNDLVLDGFSDWYLPAQEEMEAIVEDVNNVPDIAFTSHWTSSEVDDFSATAVDVTFFGGTPSTQFKTSTRRFRCVRK